MRSEAETIEYLNRFRESFLDDLGCTIVGLDRQQMSCSMEFEITKRYCHSGDIIQGGFVAAILDTVCSHAVFAASDQVVSVSTLEFKTVFLEASRAGKVYAFGRIDKMGRSVAFISGELRNEAGELTASMTTTAKIRMRKPTE